MFTTSQTKSQNVTSPTSLIGGYQFVSDRVRNNLVQALTTDRLFAALVVLRCNVYVPRN